MPGVKKDKMVLSKVFGKLAPTQSIGARNRTLSVHKVVPTRSIGTSSPQKDKMVLSKVLVSV
jgi:hypothetical protein